MGGGPRNDRTGQHELVLVLDFGSQYTQLIARRLRENRVYCEIQRYDIPAEEIRRRRPIGILLSGGPQSVYAEDAFRPDPGIWELGVPILGICYGMQLMAHALGGRVESSGEREYGRAEISIYSAEGLFAGLADHETVWMSHADRAEALPEGFVATASTQSVPVVAFEDRQRGFYGIQFHPEVSHTVSGGEILRNFLTGICRARGDWRMSSYLSESVDRIRDITRGEGVLCALSGGVDSSVVAALLLRAIGDKVTPVFVDNGLLRLGEVEQVHHSLSEGLGMPIVVVDARQRFLDALVGVTEPEEKRRIIGRVFIEVFEVEAEALEGVAFLAQGTLYPDVIESAPGHGPSEVIKSHHNVGGLPETLDFELVEPVRSLFKDEVRQLGRELGLPEEFIGRHPFPGPGLAVRVLGEVTPERLETLRAADAIFIEELRESGWYSKVSQALAVLLPVRTVGVMGDYRTYESVVALRAVETEDFMTASWSALPVELVGRISSRIVNEVRGVNRVVYDVTNKPPGTIEWE